MYNKVCRSAQGILAFADSDGKGTEFFGITQVLLVYLLEQ